MHKPETDTHFENPNTYQLRHTQAGLKHIKRSRTAIDVGAHIGIFTQRYAQHFDRVIAIEPVNTDYLWANTHQLANVELIHAAVSDTVNESVYLHNPSHNNANSGAWEITDTPTDKSIKTITIDSLELYDVDLIKIDTQGVERAVIDGATNTVQHSKPVIHIESRDDNLIQYICGKFNYVLQTTIVKDRILIAKKQ